jgi:hypothetical protein
MAKKRDRLLERLKQKKYASTRKDAEAALESWGFTAGRSKGHAQVWSCRHITLTLHAPHGRAGKKLDPGAVAMVIKKIEEAALLQEQEE